MVPGTDVRLLETETGEALMQYVIDLALLSLTVTVVSFTVTFGVGAAAITLVKVFFRP